MKQLIHRMQQWKSRTPPIPDSIMQHIASVESANVVYRSQVQNNRYWRFYDTVKDYIQYKVLWKLEEIEPKTHVIEKEQVCEKKNVLLQRVLWGEKDGVYFYGTMSFIKYKKKWYFIHSNYKVRLMRLPTFEESYAIYTNEHGEKVQSGFDEMEELYFAY